MVFPCFNNNQQFLPRSPATEREKETQAKNPPTDMRNSFLRSRLFGVTINQSRVIIALNFPARAQIKPIRRKRSADGKREEDGIGKKPGSVSVVRCLKIGQWHAAVRHRGFIALYRPGYSASILSGAAVSADYINEQYGKQVS